AAMQRRFDLGAALGRRKAASRHRVDKAVEMILEPEETVPEHVNDIIDSVRAGKAPVGDRDAGLGDGNIAAAYIGGALGEERSVHARSLPSQTICGNRLSFTLASLVLRR